MVLLLCGGGGTEHDISLMSANYLSETLKKIEGVDHIKVEIGKDSKWRTSKGELCEFRHDKTLFLIESKKLIPISYAIPCIHGPPGETGEIQSLFELAHLPYFGCRPEASILCFNKVTTKLWLSALAIPNTPYLFLSNLGEIQKAEKALSDWGAIFVKASNQGSSVGCYRVDSKERLHQVLPEAFKLSNYVLIEKAIVGGRELEVGTYDFDGHIETSYPGEIVLPSNTFYSFEEKYSKGSHTETAIKAKGLTDSQVKLLKEYAKRAFAGLKLRHLSRIDFFLTTDGEILLNEINTFPGMTPISMFPKMMEANGHPFATYIEKIINQAK